MNQEAAKETILIVEDNKETRKLIRRLRDEFRLTVMLSSLYTLRLNNFAIGLE